MDEPSANPPCSSCEKYGEDPAVIKAAQCSVASVYQTRIGGLSRNVTVVWSKNLINHSLAISVDKPDTETPFTCKIDLKPWPFWSKKGFKSFEVDRDRVDIFWDLRSAKFYYGPEPSRGYYVAMVSNEEVVLLLGDCKKDAYKRTKSRPSLVDAVLVSKRENVFGKKCFSARAKLDERRKEHDIVVENSISGPNEPEMWISIDGIVLIHVSNLQWKFRGNETVLVERVPVQVFWDVHDWLFGGPGLGHALFIFKPGAPEPAALDGSQHGSGRSSSDEIISIGSSTPACGCGLVSEFCFFLYAWKVE